MIGIGRVPVAGRSGIDAGAPPSRVFEAFEHDDAGPLSHHEAVAPLVERPRCALGIVIPARHGTVGTESSVGEGRNAGFGTAGEHHIRVPPLNDPHRIPDGIGARGAGDTGGGKRPFQAESDGDLTGGHVHQNPAHEIRVQCARPAPVHSGVPILDGLRTSDAGADDNPRPGGGEGKSLKSAVGHGHIRCGDGELGEPVHAARGFPVDPPFRTEIPDLGGHGRGISGRVETGQAADPVSPGNEAAPEFVKTDPH